MRAAVRLVLWNSATTCCDKVTGTEFLNPISRLGQMPSGCIQRNMSGSEFSRQAALPNASWLRCAVTWQNCPERI
jgi:hypothetical protein